MKYITTVIKEATRLYTPLMGFSTQSTEDCVVNGYHVPKGTVFSMLSIAMHTSEEFYEQPYEFKPDR
ncbi:cytochrome P450, partial [Brasilonema sp. CT11]|nr:cytochrome P450 [Brasilonema sp. CT11]